MENLDLSPGHGDGFWRGKRVLVTGHSGFKGGWLTLWLGALGARVTGLSLAPQTRPALFDEARVALGIESHICDVRHAAAVRDTMGSASPDIVFHLAAQALVGEGYAAPAETYATNLMGTVNLLEAARGTASVKAFVAVTSDKCYENREGGRAYREGDALGGRDPYSSSKACAELATAAYRDSFLRESGVAVASVRAGNAIGGGDWGPHRLVPDLVSAFIRRETALLRRPGAVRPWQHVLDPLAGYLILGQRLLEQGDRYAQAWNFGPAGDDAVNVATFAERMAAAWGNGARAVPEQSDFPHEAAILKLDAAKARAELGWQPRLRLDAAIAETVEWYRAWHEGKDMRAFSFAQIERYSGAEAVA